MKRSSVARRVAGCGGTGLRPAVRSDGGDGRSGLEARPYRGGRDGRVSRAPAYVGAWAGALPPNPPRSTGPRPQSVIVGGGWKPAIDTREIGSKFPTRPDRGR